MGQTYVTFHLPNGRKETRIDVAVPEVGWPFKFTGMPDGHYRVGAVDYELMDNGEDVAAQVTVVKEAEA